MASLIFFLPFYLALPVKIQPEEEFEKAGKQNKIRQPPPSSQTKTFSK